MTKKTGGEKDKDKIIAGLKGRISTLEETAGRLKKDVAEYKELNKDLLDNLIRAEVTAVKDSEALNREQQACEKLGEALARREKMIKDKDLEIEMLKKLAEHRLKKNDREYERNRAKLEAYNEVVTNIISTLKD